MKPRAVIFDIDGTAADGRHRQHLVATKPKNWPAYQRGAPLDGRWDGLHATYKAFWHMRQSTLTTSQFDPGTVGYEPRLDLLFVSGRSEDERDVTEDWLKRHEFHDYQKLIMRPSKDYRPDDIIKEEILDTHILPYYDVMLVFDDRPRVVRMWKRRGIYVLNADQREEHTEF